MYIYEGSKILYDYVLPSSSFGEKNFVCGGISKVLSTILTYPLTTIRTRAQQTQFINDANEAKYKGSWDIMHKILK